MRNHYAAFIISHCGTGCSPGNGRLRLTLLQRVVPLLLSKRLFRNRLVAFVAAITLIVGLFAYSAHGFGDRAHENGHCDLCVHFSGAAGSPVQATVVGKPVLTVRVPVERPEVVRAERRRIPTQLPRGPPDFSDLI